METPFKAISFKEHDVVTKSVLDTMHTNTQWIKENTPRARWNFPNETTRDIYGVIVSGRERIPPKKNYDTVTKSVNLRKAFAPTCKPQVVTGVVSDVGMEIFCIVNGPNGKLLPTYSGFDIKVHVDNMRAVPAGKKNPWKIPKEFFVTWHAIGWRQADINEF